MGDNRPHSSDSREFGFVNIRDISCYLPYEKFIKLSNKLKDSEKQVNTDKIAFLIQNDLPFYTQETISQVNIEEAFLQNSRVRLIKSLLENKYKEKIKIEDFNILIDNLNRQQIFCQLLINKWVIDEPLKDSNDFLTWSMIVKLHNELRRILNSYNWE